MTSQSKTSRALLVRLTRIIDCPPDTEVRVDMRDHSITVVRNGRTSTFESIEDAECFIQTTPTWSRLREIAARMRLTSEMGYSSDPDDDRTVVQFLVTSARKTS